MKWENRYLGFKILSRDFAPPSYEKLIYVMENIVSNLFLFEALLLALHKSDVLILILTICLLSFQRSNVTLKLFIFFYSWGRYISFKEESFTDTKHESAGSKIHSIRI